MNRILFGGFLLVARLAQRLQIGKFENYTCQASSSNGFARFDTRSPSDHCHFTQKEGEEEGFIIEILCESLRFASHLQLFMHPVPFAPEGVILAQRGNNPG